MSVAQNIAIVGGAGKVALHLTKLLSAQGRTITSIVRSDQRNEVVKEAGGKPVILSVEDSSVSDFAQLFEKQDVVVWSAGAGGTGSERTEAVDYRGALKVFDAIEQTSSRPRLILVSAIDIRDRSKGYPAHYDEDDRARSDRVWQVIAAYMKWKYAADKNLIGRTGFKWTIIRPGQLLEDPGTGHATIGRTHLRPPITRNDVAQVLALLVDRPDAAGLAIDLAGVEEAKRSGLSAIPAALEAFIRKGETDFEG